MTLFFNSCSDAHPDLHSFPTRRSSDLDVQNGVVTPDKDGLKIGSSAGTNVTMVLLSGAPKGVKLTSGNDGRSEEHTSELQSHSDIVCRLLLEKKKDTATDADIPRGTTE